MPGQVINKERRLLVCSPPLVLHLVTDWEQKNLLHFSFIGAYPLRFNTFCCTLVVSRVVVGCKVLVPMLLLHHKKRNHAHGD